jgi:hypothetical protein
MVGDVVEKPLDAERVLEGAKPAKLGRRKQERIKFSVPACD